MLLFSWIEDGFCGNGMLRSVKVCSYAQFLGVSLRTTNAFLIGLLVVRGRYAAGFVLSCVGGAFLGKTYHIPTIITAVMMALDGFFRCDFWGGVSFIVLYLCDRGALGNWLRTCLLLVSSCVRLIVVCHASIG